MIANIPGSVPPGVEAVHNAEPLGFGANVNRGLARTSAELVLTRESRRRARARRGRALRAFMAAHPRCGIAGPRMVFPDGTWQPSRRRFPTVAGTIVRRTPLRLVVPQRRHFHLDESPPDEPVEADWMLGGFLLLRRAMLDELGGFDEGFRLYGEDIDLAVPRDARRLGALVRPAGGRAPRAQGGDRQALADAPHPLALAPASRASCGSIQRRSGRAERRGGSAFRAEREADLRAEMRGCRRRRSRSG